MPQLAAGPDVPEAEPQTPAQWDERLTARGVTVTPARVAHGQSAWRLVKAQWLDESQAGGRHHIYVEALSEGGELLPDVPFVVSWPDGATTERTKNGRGFEAGNFAMSPSRNEFQVYIEDLAASDIVRGIGMGAMTPSGGFNAAIHTSTFIVFQKAQGKAVTAPTPQPVQGVQPPPMPTLAHPVAEARFRRVTQPFGARPEFYKQYTIDGVPLLGHEGIDYGTPVGSIVAAVDDGRVVEVADQKAIGYGKYMKIVHIWGESVYAHLSEQHAIVGELVAKGEYIAASGNTGNSDGPHLHFGMRVSPFNRKDGWGGYVNPSQYLINTGPALSPVPQPSLDLLPLIKRAAAEWGIDWQLLSSLCWAESSWNPNATSAAGAKGLCQLMDATWAEWSAKVGGSDVYNPAQNLHVGAAYFVWLLKQTHGNVYRALHAYLWGIGRILEAKEPPSEVIAYAEKIIHGRDLLKAVGN